MKKHSSWKYLVLSLGSVICLLAFSCSTVGKWIYSEPKATVKSIDVQHLSLSKLQLGIRIHLENPNSFALEVSSLDYRILAFSNVVGDGRLAEPVKLAAKASMDVTLPVNIDSEKVLMLAGRLLLHRLPAELELKGAMTVKTFIGSFDVDIDERHTITPPA